MEVKRMTKPRATKSLYFLGKFMFSLFVGLEMYFFSAYLTDAALLPVAIVGLVLNIPTIVDLIFSFLNGVIIEKLHLPFGKYRFWLIVGPIVATITYALCFLRIGDDWACGIMIIISLIIAHFFWSLAETAYNSLPTLVTDDVAERSSLSMLFGTAANWSGALYGLIAMPIITFFNKATNSMTMGYMLITVVLGILYIIAFLLLAMNIKEVEAAEAARAASDRQTAKGPSLGAMISNVTKNGPLIALLLYNLCFFTSIFTQSMLMFYYFQYVLGAVAIMGLFMTARGVASMVTTFLYAPIMKFFKGSKRNVIIFAGVLNTAYMLAMWLLRPSLTVFMVVSLIVAVIGGVANMPAIALYADCASYGEWKTGVDCKGFVMSLYNVPVKVGLTVKGFIVAAILGAISYDATATAPEVLASYATGFNNGYMLVGAILSIAGVIILLLGYHLSEAKVAQCVAETEQRKNGNLKA